MFRMDATFQTCALLASLLLNIEGTSTSAAAEVSAGISFVSASALGPSAQKLAARSRATREEAAHVADRVRRPASIRRRHNDGVAGSKNFSVTAPAGDDLAGRVLAAAERYRHQIAIDWLGDVLADGTERTLIHLEVTDHRDVGLAMLDNGQPTLRNRIWLRTSPQQAVGTTLAHEIAHVVLSARFPNGMPVWANEGIACQYDDAARRARREELLRHFKRSGRWPSVTRLLTTDVIVPTDEASYAAAVSLTEYLVALAGRPTFLEFVANGQEEGWNVALKQSYDIQSIQHLEACWRASVMSNVPETASVSTTPAKNH